MKWRGESGVLASDMARGKNSKTFQFLSFPFIASQAAENGVRGDPKKRRHPAVNADFRPEFLQHADDVLSQKLESASAPSRMKA
jgi:hypothetical protein